MYIHIKKFCGKGVSRGDDDKGKKEDYNARDKNLWFVPKVKI